MLYDANGKLIPTTEWTRENYKLPKYAALWQHSPCARCGHDYEKHNWTVLEDPEHEPCEWNDANGDCSCDGFVVPQVGGAQEGEA